MSVAYETTRRRLTDRQTEAAEQLLNAAEIEVEQTGYDALSMRGVAKRAGLASAATQPWSISGGSPGRVGSAPRSITSAPCSSSSIARANARSGSRIFCPSSEGDKAIGAMMKVRCPRRKVRDFNFQSIVLRIIAIVFPNLLSSTGSSDIVCQL